MPRNGLITHIIAIIFIMMAVFVISSDAFGGSATLIWSSPLTNEDGTPLSDLAGYKIYYGTSSGNYTQNRKVDNVTTYTVTNLTDGLTYYFAVKAFDTSLNESAYSNEVFKKIPSSQQYALTVSNASGTGLGTVTSSPAGLSCGSDCSELYNAGTVVTLSAVPDVSSTFSGWSGACTGTGSCSVTMNAAKSVNAVFNFKTYTITASAGAGGSISPSGSVFANYGVSRLFTITANSGYSISNVFVDGISVGALNSYTFSNITANHTISATFAQQQHTMTVTKSGTGTGTVTSSPAGISCGSDCSEPYNAGAVVTLSAAPYASSTFSGWSGACTGTAPCSVTMNAAKSVNASFLKNEEQTVQPLSTHLPQTGQTASYASGDDGTIQAGIEWPSPRFTDNRDGTITDTLTGLMWLKDAGCFRRSWNNSLQTVADLNANPGKYNCLDFSAKYSDWRMPNIRELESLVNFGTSNVASWLTSNGFLKALTSSYWSSTTFTGDSSSAWTINMQKGNLSSLRKRSSTYLLPVRGGL